MQLRFFKRDNRFYVMIGGLLLPWDEQWFALMANMPEGRERDWYFKNLRPLLPPHVVRYMDQIESICLKEAYLRYVNEVIDLFVNE